MARKRHSDEDILKLLREIALSSGSQVLDDAAIASVEKAVPFPAMPQEIGSEPLVVSVPYNFTVR
jgi:protein TonB